MSFAGDFSTSFPVLGVDSLNEFPKAGKGVGLVMVDHIIFDMFGESVVSLSSECYFAPLDSSSELLKFNEILHSLMIFMHAKCFEFRFGFAFRIEISKVVFKFCDEKAKIRKPDGVM